MFQKWQPLRSFFVGKDNVYEGNALLALMVQGRPLPVINGVITPINGLLNGLLNG